MPSPHSDLNPNPYPIQINASFLNNLFTIPWPKELRELLKIFGTLNLDFLDFDAAGAWIGRSMHYCTVTLGLCVAFMFLLFGVFASHRWLLAPCVLRRDKAWAAALADSCVRVGVLCCTILYPVLAARVLKLYQLRQFNELSRLDADLRMDLDEAWPWQMGGLPFVFLLVIGLPIALFCLLCRVGRPGALAGKKPAEVAAGFLKDHWKCIFNGNGYSEEWPIEAGKRGVWRIDSGVEAMARIAAPENIALFERQKVMSAKECTARAEVMHDHYTGYVEIEAMAMVDMLKQHGETLLVLPVLLAACLHPIALSCDKPHDCVMAGMAQSSRRSRRRASRR